MSIATPASLIRTGVSSVTPTSSIRAPAPSVHAMPTHPLTLGAPAQALAPAPVMGFSPDAQSKPTSRRPGRVQSDARRRDLLVSHDVFEFGADDSCKSRTLYAWQ